MERSSSWMMKSFGNCGLCGVALYSATDPQLLPCLHSLCKDCLSLTSQIKECPVCQEQYGLEDVSSNLLFTTLSFDSKESLKCQGCEDSLGTSWCVQCQESLCTECVAAHKRVKLAREHFVHAITPDCQRPVFCPIHKKNPVNVYCLTCDQLLCKICKSSHSPDHWLQYAHDAVDQQRKQIKTLAQEAHQKKLAIQKDLRDMETRLSHLGELQTRVRLEVKETVVRLCNVMVKKAARLNKEIKDLCAVEKETLSNRKTLLQKLDEKLDHVLIVTDQVMASQHHTVLLSCKKQLHCQLQRTLDQVVSPNPTSMELSFHSNENYVKKTLQTFGCIMAKDIPYSENVTNPPLEQSQNYSPSASPVTLEKPSLFSTPSLSSPPSINPSLPTPPSSSPSGALSFMTSSDPARFSFPISSFQNKKYSNFPKLKKASSFHPYLPKESSQLSVKPVKHKKKIKQLCSSPQGSEAGTAVFPLFYKSLNTKTAVDHRSYDALGISELLPNQQVAESSPFKVVQGALRSPPSVDKRNKDKVKRMTFSEANAKLPPLQTQDIEDVIVISPQKDSSSPLQQPKKSPENRSLSEDHLNLQNIRFRTRASTRASKLIQDEQSTDHSTKTHKDTEDNAQLQIRPSSSQVKNDLTSATKIRDAQGNLVALESLGRNWLPKVSVSRLSLPGCPAVSDALKYCFLWNKESDSFQLSVISEDTQGLVLDPVTLSTAPCPTGRKADRKESCAACGIGKNLLRCSSCQRAFHRDCHIPPITAMGGEQWQCTLCNDLSEEEPLQAESEDPQHLSPQDQRKCEYLLLSLCCNKRSSVLYMTVKASSKSPRYIDMTIIRSRLLKKLGPDYQSCGEFVSEVWLLLHMLRNSTKEKKPVKKLQKYFTKKLRKVFKQSLHPSFLEDPFAGNHEQQKDGNKT
ncbi:transcription intermediary factor 1-beta-like [Hoplias malabaricus]|uniref:transcription intermediary factor 1-beta-like n=1 Tax=Hoplias malabaricus TaxID=27720 RepID=UPI0034632179